MSMLNSEDVRALCRQWESLWEGSNGSLQPKENVKLADISQVGEAIIDRLAYEIMHNLYKRESEDGF